MPNSSSHPELNQPIPRQVKMRQGTFVCVVVFFFGFIITSSSYFLAISTLQNSGFQPVSLIVLVAPLILLVGIFYNFSKYLRERKLLMWGNIAEAKTFEGPEYAGERLGYFMNVLYEFKDTDGKLIEGRQKFPARTDKWKYAKKFVQKLDHPVVLYEAGNSEINMLYPGFCAECPPQDATNTK